MERKMFKSVKAVIGATVAGFLMLATPVAAEIELSFYGGSQSEVVLQNRTVC
jgi:hypothetical protein